MTELRARHAAGDRAAGINVRKGLVSNILDEQVVQPLLVATSAISLASETAALILRIDGASCRAGSSSSFGMGRMAAATASFRASKLTLHRLRADPVDHRCM